MQALTPCHLCRCLLETGKAGFCAHGGTRAGKGFALVTRAGACAGFVGLAQIP
jgi:hypothetical protein